MSKVLIIGNGFDLDLGFRTSYRDFLKSDFFPNSTVDRGLIYHIKKVFEIKNWIDLENEIKFYALKFKGANCDILRREFNDLSIGLCDYLNNNSYNSRIASSCANRLLKILVKSPSLKIFNFNYTPFEVIYSEILSQSRHYEIKHVHGTIHNRNIIIGIEDEADIADEHCFLIKSHNRYYRSINLGESLLNNDNDEIIIFGHSLGLTDYYYFADFFQQQSNVIFSKEIAKRKITIFTSDYNSKEALLLQLRKMNNKSTLRLYEKSILNIFCTQELEDETRISVYLNELEDYIYKHSAEYINQITSSLLI